MLAGLILWGTRGALAAAVTVFVVGAVTDRLDGYLARRYGHVTRTGAWLDPLADKLFMAAAIVPLAVVGPFPEWAAAVILFREFGVIVLRSWLGTRGRSMPASQLGKVKTASQELAVLLYLIPNAVESLRPAPFIILIIAVVFTVWSGLQYAADALRPYAGAPRRGRG